MGEACELEVLQLSVFTAAEIDAANPASKGSRPETSELILMPADLSSRFSRGTGPTK